MMPNNELCVIVISTFTRVRVHRLVFTNIPTSSCPFDAQILALSHLRFTVFVHCVNTSLISTLRMPQTYVFSMFISLLFFSLLCLSHVQCIFTDLHLYIADLFSCYVTRHLHPDNCLFCRCFQWFSLFHMWVFFCYFFSPLI